MKTKHFMAKVIIYLLYSANFDLGLCLGLKDGEVLSTIGSPNFGYRSESRDNELQFYIFSKNADFNKTLTDVKIKIFLFWQITKDCY